MENEYVIAIDIGGTNLKADLVDKEGNISDFSYTPSHASEGRDALLASLKTIIKAQITTGRKIVGIAAGSPGTVNNSTSVIDYMQAHIPNWTGTKLGEFLTEQAGVPSQIDNDANVIALGEYWKGAGQGAKCLLALALGTGLGSGLVLDGKVMHGPFFNAVEVGHTIVCPDGTNVACSCGNYGCAESFISPGKMISRAHLSMQVGVPSVLGGYPKLSIAQIQERYKNGDEPEFNVKDMVDHYEDDFLCKRLIDDCMKYLALLIYNLTKCYDPDVISLGGGMFKSAEFFLPKLYKQLDRYYVSPDCPAKYKIKVSELGDLAGIYGAAKLAWDHVDALRAKHA